MFGTVRPQSATESRPCPRCGCRSLQPLRAAGEARLFCTACQRCWSKEFGYLIEVNRYSCPGCDDRTRCRLAVCGGPGEEGDASTAVDSTTARLVDLLGW